MSNPWKRDWSGRDDEGNEITLDGDRIAQIARALWHLFEVISAVARPDPDPERSALRIRHGARAACKRLRKERDEAHGAIRFTSIALDTAVTQRDAARLELRALEWLAVKGYPHWISCDDTTRIVHGHTGPDWQTAARALGWEG